MKEFIANRHHQKICVVTHNCQNGVGLAFVMHGLGGNKEQPHILAIVDAFIERGYKVVTFDTTNTFGESDGKYEDATITNYYSDLEDVIAWASAQTWYEEPFILCGHSLGGISTALYAQQHPLKVRALAPISTVISGKVSIEAHRASNNLEDIDKWEKKGISTTLSYDGKREKRLKWSHMQDRLRYDLLPQADKLTMPVLMVVGEKDDPTPPAHQQLLFDVLPGRKELRIVKGAEHSFYEPHEQAELKELIKNWLHSL